MASVASDRINEQSTNKKDGLDDGDMNKSAKDIYSEVVHSKTSHHSAGAVHKSTDSLPKKTEAGSDVEKSSRSTSLSIQVTEVSSVALDSAALPMIDVISGSKTDSASIVGSSGTMTKQSKTLAAKNDSGSQESAKESTKEHSADGDNTESELDIKNNLAAAAAAAADPTNLIVNYVPSSIQEAEFRKMFEPFGEIASCRLIFDRLSGRHMGYGFVKYHGQSSAEKAILKYHGFHIENKRLKVSFARPSGGTKRSNLYISGLPVFYTEQQLADLFAPYGKVIDTKILRSQYTTFHCLLSCCFSSLSLSL